MTCFLFFNAFAMLGNLATEFVRFVSSLSTVTLILYSVVIFHLDVSTQNAQHSTTTLDAVPWMRIYSTTTLDAVPWMRIQYNHIRCSTVDENLQYNRIRCSTVDENTVQPH